MGCLRVLLVGYALMFVCLLQEEHRGIRQVKVAEAQVDTARHRGDVFLVLSYGDSTSEQIVVPMVCQDGVWYMK